VRIPGARTIKLFTVIIVTISQKAGVFSSSQIVTSRLGAYQGGDPYRTSHYR